MYGAVIELDALSDSYRAGAQDQDLFQGLCFHRFIFPAVNGIVIRCAGCKFRGAGIHHFIGSDDAVVIAHLLDFGFRQAGEAADYIVREFNALRFAQQLYRERLHLKGLFHFHKYGYFIDEPVIHHGDFMNRIIVDALANGFGNDINSLIIHFFQAFLQFFRRKL